MRNPCGLRQICALRAFEKTKTRPLAARHLPGDVRLRLQPPAVPVAWGRWSASMMRFAKSSPVRTRSARLRCGFRFVIDPAHLRHSLPAAALLAAHLRQRAHGNGLRTLQGVAEGVKCRPEAAAQPCGLLRRARTGEDGRSEHLTHGA